MKPFILGLAGGSGSGKSTLAFGLQDLLDGKATIVHLDDYFKKEADVPRFANVANWDDPEALRHQQMVADIKDLIKGKAVSIYTKSPRLNPEYAKNEQRIYVEHQPNPLIIVEGFLTLHYPDLRKLINFSIYLKAPFDTHIERRVHGTNTYYSNNVIKPMHEKYVSPSESYADKVIEVTDNPKEQVLKEVVTVLPKHLFQIQESSSRLEF